MATSARLLPRPPAPGTGEGLPFVTDPHGPLGLWVPENEQGRGSQCRGAGSYPAVPRPTLGTVTTAA